MATGIDLRQVTGQRGSEFVQRSGADPVGAAVSGFGQTLFNVGTEMQARKTKREQEQEKLEADLQAERQKIYDSNSTAFIQRSVDAASSAVDIAIAQDPSNPASWRKAFDDANAEVDKALEQVGGDMSPEKQDAALNRVLAARQDETAALALATIKQEEVAKNESWRLNAQLHAEAGRFDMMEDAINEVSWQNEAEKDKFRLNTRRSGRYNALNRQMLSIEDPDKLNEMKDEILAMSQEDLKPSDRDTLVVVAQQRANRIQKGYNSTMRGLKSRLKRMDFPGVEEINELIASNQMDSEMLDSYYEMYDEASTRADYKQIYDTETAQPTFQRKETEILENYLLADTAPENVILTREQKQKLIKEINELPLKSAWAKNDLYSLVFESATEALREPDDTWLGLRDDPVGPEEREFRMDYNQRLQTYAKTGQLSQDFGRLFLANEARITEAYSKGDVNGEKLMDDLTKLVVDSMMNENLKRQLGVLPTRVEQQSE